MHPKTLSNFWGAYHNVGGAFTGMIATGLLICNTSFLIYKYEYETYAFTQGIEDDADIE